MARRLVLFAVVLALSTPAVAEAQLLWSVRTTCRVEPHVPVGIWFTVVSLHNQTAVSVPVDWQVITEEGGIEGSGSFTLGPDEVEEIDCFEAPFNLPDTGFFEIQAPRLIQVVVTNKNIEAAELYEDKGYPIPAQQIGADTWTYASEFVCGDLEPVAPGSVLDLLELIPEEDRARVWRPGRSLTELFVFNPTAQPVAYDFRVVSSDGEVLVSRAPQRLPAGGATKFDCTVLPLVEPARGADRNVLLPQPRTDGMFVIDAASSQLSVRWDKTKYVSILAAALEMEYARPIRRRLAAGLAAPAEEVTEENGGRP